MRSYKLIDLSIHQLNRWHFQSQIVYLTSHQLVSILKMIGLKWEHSSCTIQVHSASAMNAEHEAHALTAADFLVVVYSPVATKPRNTNEIFSRKRLVPAKFLQESANLPQIAFDYCHPIKIPTTLLVPQNHSNQHQEEGATDLVAAEGKDEVWR